MGSAPPPGLKVRAVERTDAAAIAALITAVDSSFGLGPWVAEVDISEDFGDPDLDLSTDTWVVEDAGEIVGYCEIWNTRREDTEALEAQGWVLPSHRGLGVGSFLVESFERAGEAAADRLARRPLVLRTYFTGEDEAARDLFERRGYRLVRHFFHMAVDLDDVSTEPVEPPAGLTMRTLDADVDGPMLHEFIEEVFAEHWNWAPMSSENFWRRVTDRDGFDPALNLIVFDGDRMVGAALNVVKLGQGWVNDLGVRKDMRGRGIGELLLRNSFATFKRRGMREARLGVDAGNLTGAVRLYERVGMREIRRFDTYDKVLRR